MKQLFTLLAMLLMALSANEVSAQGWLEHLGNRVKDRVKEKTEDKVLEKVDRGMDSAFDAAENSGSNSDAQEEDEPKKKKKDKKQRKQADEEEEYAEAEPQPKAKKQAAAEPKAAEMAYAKSDFVRGDEVFFEDQLVGEQLGEFPSQWDALNGSVEIGKINGENAIMAQQPGDRTAPLFKDMKSYLPEKFTLEFDFWAENPDYEGHNEYIIQFNDKDNNTEWVQNIILGSVGTDSDWSSVRWQFYPTSGDDWREGTLENIKYILNSWNHCAISFNKRAMKIYINGVRVANIPNTRQPNNFSIEFGGDGIGRMAHASIKNIVLAKGAVPLYDRMMSDGKFITYGITFDVGKSVVKPESMGEITRIVQLMNENPTLKFSVEGHTDATGNAASNQKLSEARANAIVAKLVENGIAKDRLTAVGKGQNNPIADNNTDEGRAKNRRVEFVKQ